MDIKITSRDFDLTEAIRNAIEENISRMNKYDLQNTTVEVVLENENSGQKIEVLLINNGKRFFSKSTDVDLYKAIDTSIGAVEKQVSKYIDSMKDSNKRSIRYPENSQKETDNEESKIVKRIEITAKPMDENEAILQMEALDHRSFMFHNIDTDSPCMIYKRHDGYYGIVETSI